jgi:Zn-dependent protease
MKKTLKNLLLNEYDIGKIPMLDTKIIINPSLWLFTILMVIINLIIGGVSSAIVTFCIILGLYGSVLLHEFGHVVAASRLGHETSKITLYMFGGSADISDMESVISKNPIKEFIISIAGPMVNMVIFLLLTGLFWLIAQFGGLVTGEELENGNSIYICIWQIGTVWIAINIILPVYNLIPAFPLDGGRILRSILGMFSIPWKQATIATVKTGIVTHTLLLVAGLYFGQYFVVILSLIFAATCYVYLQKINNNEEIKMG